MGLLKELFIYIKNNYKNIYRKIISILPNIILILLILIMCICLYKFFNIIKISISEKAIKSTEYDTKIVELNNKINVLEDKLNNMNIRLNEMDTNINMIEDNINSMREYQVREINISKDHAKIGIKIMNENFINPELLFAIIDTRSGGDLFKTIPNSTARGYGLMIESTSRWVYEDIMGNENYTHDMQFDGSKSIEILANYIVYLMEVYDGNIEKLLYSYVGGDDKDFINNINNYLKARNINIKDIEYVYNTWRDNT